MKKKKWIRILTTYPIPQSALWRKRTELIAPRIEKGRGLLARFGFRDWTLTLRLLKVRHQYDVLITGCEREDCLFAFLQSCLPGKRIPHLMTCCLWKEETNPVRYWWKRFLLQIISRSVGLFIVWSSEECDAYPAYFGLPREKFVFMPHHASLEGYDVAAREGEYLFAGGDSSRDYHTLIDAVRSLDVPTIIVARQAASLNGDGKRLPTHVNVKTTDPIEFRRLMAGSRLVVIPIEEGLLQSAGQQSYLNAMLLRKPVIVSQVKGVMDHVTPNVTGVVVPPKNPEALREAILQVLAGGPEVQKMVERAYQRVQEKFSLEEFVHRLLAFTETFHGKG